ncbi:MAG: B12-binding domain-containing radical SAM protein [Chloroflexi bacterium]|nr:B12-binding domain-containing radical SAM protein [Chloroflexota bacterium]
MDDRVIDITATKPVKVQFVYVPKYRKPWYGKMIIGTNIPLGILYLGAYLREKQPDLTLDVVDGTVASYSDTLARIVAFAPDVLCLSYTTMEAMSAYRLVQDVRRRLGKVCVIVGGPHATALPKEALERADVDVVGIGEGEATLHELVSLVRSEGALNYDSLRRVKGIAFRDGKQPVVNQPRPYLPELDSLPWPARDLIDLKKYQGWPFFRQKPQTNVLWSRGCPFNCTFCANSVWRTGGLRYRIRSAHNVADELEWLARHQGIREVFDNGDEFNTNMEAALAICHEIKRRELGVTWKASLRARPLTDELARAMAESGCWFAYVGVESGNPSTLAGIQKRITPDDVVEACRILKRYDIKVFGLFMLNNVWEEDGKLRFEDNQLSENTLRFAKHLMHSGLLDYMSWSQTTPYPGSALYDIALRHRLIPDALIGNWDAWSRAIWLSQVIRLPGVSAREQMRVRLEGSRLVAWATYRDSGDYRHLVRYYLSTALRLLIANLGLGERLARRNAPPCGPVRPGR